MGLKSSFMIAKRSLWRRKTKNLSTILAVILGVTLLVGIQITTGQMQRVAIARALTNRLAVIFADEPTGDLDSATVKQVLDLLRKFHEETKATIIFITHEQGIADYA